MSPGQNPQALRAMLEVYQAEAAALKERLSDSQTEVGSLRSRLRDAEGELSVAQAATSEATERLAQHGQRHGLVLQAGLERIGAERATLEDDLQRMERQLAERDQEIAMLRKEANSLEAQHLHHEMELQGLQAMGEARNAAEAQRSMARNSDLMEQFSLNSADRAPVSRELARHADTKASLAAKLETLAALKQQAEVMALEAQRLEAEEAAAGQNAAAFEQSLRQKQADFDAQDKRYFDEMELLRQHNEGLRQQLQQLQQDSMGIDQRAVLVQQCSMEAEGVRNEVNTILAMMPKYAETLGNRGRSVQSVPVEDDPTDVRLHMYLRAIGRGEADAPPLPPVVCRLGQGDYVLCRERVQLKDRDGQLFVNASGSDVFIGDFLRAQAGR